MLPVSGSDRAFAEKGEMNARATATMIDFYRRHINRTASDQQYVLMSFLTDERFDILRKTRLASALRAKIKPPAGMRFREP